jgi:GTPase
LIRKLSAATPKVADYPFTTLKPVLGLVEVAPGQSFVLVDIPGLIEGAAEGKGLGHQFLRHIERSFCLAYIIDASGEDPFGQYQVLRSEMEKFHPLLLEKPRLIAMNKCDLGAFKFDKRFKKEGCAILRISALTGDGLGELKQAMRELIGEKGIRKQGW